MSDSDNLKNVYKNKVTYFDTIMLVERFYRFFSEEITHYLNILQITDINYVQCLILYNIADNKIRIGQLSSLGYYLGSNPTYNIGKMIENGYIVSTLNEYDRRCTYICLSEKGLSLYKNLYDYFIMQTNPIELNDIKLSI